MARDGSHRGGLTLVLCAVGIVALMVHFAQGYTGQLQLQRQYQRSSGPTNTTGSSPYPRQATDQNAQTLTLARPTRRVVSQYWSIDEMLYSVLPPEHVVGVSQYAYDHRTSNVYRWADTLRPIVALNPETVLTATPDLLLVSSSARADLTSLMRNAGVPTFRMFTDYKNLDQISKNIALTGYLTGADVAAQKVQEEFQNAIRRAAVRRPPGSRLPRVLGYSGRYSYGSETSFNDVLVAIGATNVAGDHGLRGYAAISNEQILRWDPEWLISRAAPGETDAALQRLLEDPAIALTTAAQRGQILVLGNNVFLPMSPFTANLLDVLSEALYGNHAKK